MPHRPQKSLLAAYLLWFFFGLFGVHRFYLGNWFSGALYFLSFGFYAFGWLLDLFLLPWLVASANRRLERYEELEEAADDEVLVLTPVDEATPAKRGKAAVRALPPPLWAVTRRFQVFEFVLQLLFFLAAPCLFVLLALMIEQYVLLAIMAVTMLVCAFLGRLEDFLQRYPTLEKAPAVGQALSFLSSAGDFYRVNAPFHFAYYLFFPLTAPIALCFSPVARKEFIFFARVIGGMMLVVVAQLGLGYFETYPPHLGPVEAVGTMVFICLMILFLILVFIVPTVTTAMTLTAAKRTGYLRVLVFVGLITGLPITIMYFYATGPMPVTPSVLLDQRFNKESFQIDLTDSAKMFLSYWHDQPLTGTATERGAALTDKFRRSIDGHMTGYETRAFRIETVDADPNAGANVKPWVVLAVYSLQMSDYSPYWLFVAGPDGRIYSRWSDLPPELTVQVRVSVAIPTMGGADRRLYVRAPVLFEELRRTKIALNKTEVDGGI